MKRAVLIAMADESPFREIHEELHPELELLYSQSGYDVFYVYAKKTSRLETRIRRAIEEIRWGKYHLLLRVYDILVLSRFRFKVPKVQLDGNYIRVNVPEDLRHLSIKILTSLAVLRSLDYDLVIRTTASSILHPRLIRALISKVAQSHGLYYGGREITQADGFTFISGSFTIWNSKAIDHLLKNRRSLDYSLIDDVCFGRLFKSTSTTTENLTSINVGDLSAIPSIQTIERTFHFRCRTGITKRSDLVVMRKLVELINSTD